MRALKYWAEKGQPPIPGQPSCLAKSVMELQWAMEAGVFTAVVPSNWMEVSLSRLTKPISWDPTQTTATGVVTAKVARPTQGDPWMHPDVKADLLPLPGQTCPPLHPGRWCHHSPTASTHALLLGSWRLHKPWEEKNPRKAAHHRSSAFHLKKSLTCMRTWGQWWWQSTCFGTPPWGRYSLISSHVHWGLWAWGLIP